MPRKILHPLHPPLLACLHRLRMYRRGVHPFWVTLHGLLLFPLLAALVFGGLCRVGYHVGFEPTDHLMEYDTTVFEPRYVSSFTNTPIDRRTKQQRTEGLNNEYLYQIVFYCTIANHLRHVWSATYMDQKISQTHF